MKQKKLDNWVGKKIVVGNCTAQREAFKNMLPNSVHTIVKPPKGQSNSDRRVWVKGKGHKVGLLAHEFTYMKFERNKNKST